MASSIFSIFSRTRAVDQPAFQCPQNKGVIEVEVIHHYPGDRNRERQPVEKATATVSGGISARDPRDTKANGKYRFDPVSPANYTVTITFTAEQAEKFDTNAINPGLAQTLQITGGNTTNYLFEVPGYYIEYLVRDGTNPGNNPPGNPLANVGWLLEFRAQGANAFERMESGVSAANGRIYRYPVKRGRYKLTLRTLTNPQWSANRAVVGTAIEMTARVTGAEPGVNGRMEVLDPFDLATVLQSIPTTTRAGVGGPVIAATWTPAEGRLNPLRHGQVVFRAIYETASVISAPLPLFRPEKIQSRTTTGANADMQIKLNFSGGGSVQVTAAGGRADVEIPWAETVTRISFPQEYGLRVQAEGVGTTGSVAVPAMDDIV
jgi:hypothetical protein